MQDAHTTSQAHSIETSEYGTLHLEDRHLVEFPQGLHGFEHLRKFVVIADDSLVPFKWLLSIENPSIGFPILSPFQVDFSYQTEVEYDPACCAPMVIVTLYDSEKQTATANMRAPIIFDMKRGTAQQILATDSAYSENHPIVQNTNSRNTTTKKRIYTSQFGALDIDPSQIITFGEGILGFDHLHDFILVAEEDMAPLEWLVSLENPSIGLPIINPWYIYDEYEFRDYDQQRDVVYVVVTLGSRSDRMTVNLQAPIVINPSAKTGHQLILPSDKYLTEFPIGTHSGSEQ